MWTRARIKIRTDTSYRADDAVIYDPADSGDAISASLLAPPPLPLPSKGG